MPHCLLWQLPPYCIKMTHYKLKKNLLDKYEHNCRVFLFYPKCNHTSQPRNHTRSLAANYTCVVLCCLLLNKEETTISNYNKEYCMNFHCSLT